MNGDRKKIFAWSDLNIGHANVLVFDKRPFKDLDDMHEVLVNNYNATVRDGVCYFLGDVGLCKTDIVKNVISQMTGTKVCILGNHDKGVEAMYKVGFDVVLYGATMQIAGERVTLSHCPLLGVYREKCEGMNGAQTGENWHGESRPKHRIFTVANEGQFHIHGHIHSPNSGKSQKILGRQRDVGVAANGYRPVNISEIESWIVKTKQEELLKLDPKPSSQE